MVEEGLDFGWLAADLEECGLAILLLMMFMRGHFGSLFFRGGRNLGSYPESSRCSFGHDFSGGQTSEREDEEVGDVGLDLRIEECVEEARNELFG